MPKFLYQANYVGEGFKGLIKEGGTSRHDAVRKLVESLGGTLESFYFAIGTTDVVGVADLPDNVSLATFSLMINASGAVSGHATVLLTPEELDEVSQKTDTYRPPGS